MDENTYFSHSSHIAHQKWMKKQLEKRASEYCDVNPVLVYCGTWNVAANLPPEESSKASPERNSMAEWLFAENFYVDPGSCSGYDLYAIGLQEMVGLNVMNVVMTNR
eukprot:gene24013-31186_t